MKEKIYTIPVTDALKEATFCPFCYLHDKLDREAVEYTLGPSYMEDDIRAVTDELGFCHRHYDTIMNEQNKLGVALMSHTHIQKLIRDIEKLKDETVSKKPLFKKVTTESESKIVKYTKKSSSTCYICNRANDTLERYIDSFLYLFNNDENIKNLFIESKGVCYTHFSKLLEESEIKMKAEECNAFRQLLISKQLSNLKVLEEDLDFFIKKFDYKNNDIPWGGQRDILSRVSTGLK